MTINFVLHNQVFVTLFSVRVEYIDFQTALQVRKWLTYTECVILIQETPCFPS